MRMMLSYGRFAGNERGAIAVIFAVSLMVVSLVVALSIDTARAYDVRTRIQAALDAAALAGAKLLDKEGATEADVKAHAESFFREQLMRLAISDVHIENFDVDPDWSTSTLTARVDVAMGSMFKDVSGTGGLMEFSPQSTATYHALKIELSLVADVTGSMCDTPPAVGDPPCTSAAKLDALKAAARDMVTALSSSNPGAGAVRVGLVPYSASVNAGAFAAAVSAGASADGCVVERSGADAFTNDSPYAQPVGAVVPGSLPFYSCAPSPIRPLADLASAGERDALLSAIDGLAGSGGTAGHIGTAWGWYLLSPEWSGLFGSRAGRGWDPAKVMKVVVLMTDGDFNISYANGGETNPWPDPLSSDASHPGSSGHQALQLCEEIKSLGDASKSVRIYTVAFQAPAGAEAMLKQCSGEENYYDAANASQLNAAFRDIVRRLNTLRMTS
ncbi:MAG: hypothetical protein C0519_03725 [Hyphomicrobium sp.]|nr:hypothetical protein [Hyphomicrobium sp.]PPD07385.1 MAG: hypothetical protein CTY28_09785 [Hyphomicrobium sp.]